MRATLDRESSLQSGDLLPPAWHWLYFHDVVKASDLGSEGHPRLGITMEAAQTRYWRADQAARKVTAMPQVDEQGRLEPPVSAGEVETLLGFLDYQRATLAWKCSALDAAGLCAKVGVSSMTLGGLLKHMAFVEDYWFSVRLHGNKPHAPWDMVDWKAAPDWDWESATGDSPEALRALWTAAVERSREFVGEALATGGLDQAAKRPWPDGESPSLRWIVVHMIEEYARHNGHADLLREFVDGETGE